MGPIRGWQVNPGSSRVGVELPELIERAVKALDFHELEQALVDLGFESHISIIYFRVRDARQLGPGPRDQLPLLGSQSGPGVTSAGSCPTCGRPAGPNAFASDRVRIAARSFQWARNKEAPVGRAFFSRGITSANIVEVAEQVAAV